MAKRKKFSKKERDLLLRRHKSRCCICGDAINDPGWILEHIKPLWLGGSNRSGNIGPAHMACALAKTGAETTTRAKVERVRKKHLGWRRPQRRPMIGTMASGWRRRMDGTLERRNG